MDHETFIALSKPTALVVDDDPFILMDTANIMSDAGYEVIEAQTADEAYEFLTQHRSLRVVFTDIQMPGQIDGIELASIIAEQWPYIKVIVASGAVRPAHGVLPEGTVFLNKPVSAQIVNQTLYGFFGHKAG